MGWLGHKIGKYFHDSVHGSWNHWFIDSCLSNTLFSPIWGHYCSGTNRANLYYTKDRINLFPSHQDLQNLYNMVGSAILTYLIPHKRPISFETSALAVLALVCPLRISYGFLLTIGYHTFAETCVPSTSVSSRCLVALP